MPTDGAVVGLDSVGAFEGSRALRITFDGSRNIEYGHVFQYVPVQADTRYRFFRSYAGAGDHPDSGPRLQVCDAYNPGHLFVSRKTSWVALVGRNSGLNSRPPPTLTCCS